MQIHKGLLKIHCHSHPERCSSPTNRGKQKEVSRNPTQHMRSIRQMFRLRFALLNMTEKRFLSVRL